MYNFKPIDLMRNKHQIPKILTLSLILITLQRILEEISKIGFNWHRLSFADATS